MFKAPIFIQIFIKDTCFAPVLSVVYEGLYEQANMAVFYENFSLTMTVRR